MRSLRRLLARCRARTGPQEAELERPGDRRRRIGRCVAAAIAAFAALLLLVTLYALYVEPYWIRYHDVEVRISGLPREFDGFTIALVADIHGGEHFGSERVRGVMDRVRERRPDAVAIAGDLVQEREAWEGVFREIARLAREVPTYVVPGNHDYWQGIARYRELISDNPAIDLTNAHRVIERGGRRLVIAGLDDFTDGEPDLDKALAGVDSGGQPVVLVMHNPDLFPTVLAKAPGVDLVLAGHTHGGQVCLPFLGPPVLPIQRREHASGLVREGATQMYVSRGVGMLAKLRFNCRPEVPYLVLRAE